MVCSLSRGRKGRHGGEVWKGREAQISCQAASKHCACCTEGKGNLWHLWQPLHSAGIHSLQELLTFGQRASIYSDLEGSQAGEDPGSWGSALLLMGYLELNLLGHPTCLVSQQCWRLPGKHCSWALWPSHCSRACLGMRWCHWPCMATGGAWLLAVLAGWWAVGTACGSLQRAWPRRGKGGFV